MKVLSLNNVSSSLGGTLHCSASICKALPDCEHKVFSFSAEFGPAARELFGPAVTLSNGINAKEALKDFEPDVVIWHNTSASRIPDSPLGGAIQVYMQHSAHKDAPQARAKCHLQIAVSQWLAAKVGMAPETVLYQPVGIPPRPSGERDCTRDYLVVGRICTPNERKWKLEELDPWYHALEEAHPGKLEFHWVAPPNYRVDIASRYHGRVSDRFYPPSLEARSLLHLWDVLFYTSELEESYGRTVKEAQRCGCVPVVSDKGAFPEQISPDAGYLVRTPQDAVDAIGELLDRKVWDEVSARCKARGDAQGGLSVWREAFLQRLAKV